MNRKVWDAFFFVCTILLIFSSVGYVFEWTFVPLLYAISGAGVAVYLLSTPYRGDNLRLKRLNIQQSIAALLLPVSSFLMYKGLNEWFVCLLVSALLILYVVFVREHEEKKGNGNDHEHSERADKKRR